MSISTVAAQNKNTEFPLSPMIVFTDAGAISWVPQSSPPDVPVFGGGVITGPYVYTSMVNSMLTSGGGQCEVKITPSKGYLFDADSVSEHGAEASDVAAAMIHMAREHAPGVITINETMRSVVKSMDVFSIK